MIKLVELRGGVRFEEPPPVDVVVQLQLMFKFKFLSLVASLL